MWINQVVQLVQLCQLAIHKHKQLSICGMWSNVSIQMEMAIWWWSRKPKENYLRGKPLQGKPSPLKQIHYSKINFTILGFFFFFSLDSMAHRKLFIAAKCLDSSIIWTATTDDAPVIMTKTSNWLQGLLKKFLHNKKFVVGIVALASSTNLQIYLNKVKFERN